jgi:hypothetical protein
MMLRRYHPRQTLMDQPTCLQRIVRGIANQVSNTCVAQMAAQKSRQHGNKFTHERAASAAAGKLLSNTATSAFGNSSCDNCPVWAELYGDRRWVTERDRIGTIDMLFPTDTTPPHV